MKEDINKIKNQYQAIVVALVLISMVIIIYNWNITKIYLVALIAFGIFGVFGESFGTKMKFWRFYCGYIPPRTISLAWGAAGTIVLCIINKIMVFVK